MVGETRKKQGTQEIMSGDERGNNVMVGERLSDHCCGLEGFTSWMLCGGSSKVKPKKSKGNSNDIKKKGK